jgi:hypothetical protein
MEVIIHCHIQQEHIFLLQFSRIKSSGLFQLRKIYVITNP